MALFVLIAVTIGISIWKKIPSRVVLPAILILCVVIVVLQLAMLRGITSPGINNVIQQVSGSDIAPWLTLSVVLILFGAYLEILRLLRTWARPVSPQTSGTFSDTELDRYARHIVMREIGGAGQKKLKNARVLVIGAGGLGSPVLQYLAAAGVGTIGVIDDDVVDNSNLQRQVIHQDAAIGTPKVMSAQAMMLSQNPFITVKPYQRRLDDTIARDLFEDYDIIIEGSDNFETRYLANRTAVALGKPLVSGALSQWEGQVAVFHPAQSGPCYQCVFPQKPAEGMAPSCAEAGVFAPLPGVIGAMMAGEAMKLIMGAGQALIGEMLIYDALYGETRKFSIKQRPECDICGAKHGE